MHALGRDLSQLLKAGDVVLLAGELGAGKTQLTQGIGEGLRVAGGVISPTFVLSRIHRSLVGGLGLVHVDAYRLTSSDEVDDLDLEAYMADCVIVVEWGRGLADHLSADRLDIEIIRSDDPDDDVRQVSIVGIGPRWESLAHEWEQVVNREDPALASAESEGFFAEVGAGRGQGES
jgi:tRNA threonylcarbamoyladenosine biosynthesis protein TsaE